MNIIRVNKEEISDIKCKNIKMKNCCVVSTKKNITFNKEDKKTREIYKHENLQNKESYKRNILPKNSN